MSLKACFDRAAGMGVISREEANALKKRFDQIAAETTNAAEARARMAKEIEAEAAHRERAALLTEIARSRIIDQMSNWKNHKGETDLVTAFIAMHENLGNEIGDFMQDAEGRREVIFRDAQRELREIMREFRRGAITGDLRRTSKLVGNSKVQARMDNFRKEVFGEDTGDATAKAMAQSWNKVVEDLRVRFNAAGGAIPKLEGWGFPQSHDRLALLDAGKQSWIDYLMQPGVLARDRMVDRAGARLTDSELREALDVAYDRATTDGWSDKDVSAQPKGRGALYTQHLDHRFIHFKDADAWGAYAEKFGNPDLFATMMGHVAMMSRDIAHAEIFGPNPNMMRAYIRSHIEHMAGQQASGQGMAIEGADPRNVMQDVSKGLDRADAMWSLMRGQEVVGRNLAEIMGSVRNTITASSLGAAWISSLSDAGFGQDMRHRLGMGMAKANFGRMLAGSLREMITMGSRQEMIDAGLGLDQAMNVLRKKASEVKGIDHRFWTGFLADRTLTWGLLSPWTQAGKFLAGDDIMRYMAKLAPHSFDALPEGMQRAFRNHGFSPADWDALRATGVVEGRIRPTELLDNPSTKALGERYLQMILRETRSAIPEATVASRSIVFTSGKPGTITGEIARSAGQFKGFGLAVLMIHAGRLARQLGAGDTRNALANGGALLITLTFLGAIAMALKDIKDGRDPRKWLDEKTWLDPNHWGAAFLQAGGLGIYGDLLFADVNRHGGGLESTIAGPLVGRASDIGDLVIGEPIRALTGKPTNPGGKAMKVLKSNTPIMGHWAISLAYQRTVMDQLQKLADPKAQAAFNRTIQQRQRDYGQSYWWRPGTTSPQRAPDFSKPLSTR